MTAASYRRWREHMHAEFKSHRLTDEGLSRAREIGEEFDRLLGSLLLHWGAIPKADPRCIAMVRTRLEEACFYAKKAIASDPRLQEPEVR